MEVAEAQGARRGAASSAPGLDPARDEHVDVGEEDAQRSRP